MNEREIERVLAILSQTELSVEEIAQKLTNEVRRVTDKKNCIFITEARGGEDFFVLVAGSPRSQYNVGEKTPIREHLALQKTLMEKNFLLLDVDKTPLLNNSQKRWEKGAGVKKLFLVPIIFRDKVLGIIVVDVLEGEKVSKRQMNFVSGIAGQAAWVLNNAFLLKEKETREEEMAQAIRLATLGRETSMLAHDLRNLIVAAGGLANLLLKLPDTDDSRYVIIEKISEELGRAEKWLDDHLNFIKGEMAVKEISLARFLKKIVKNFEGEINLSIDISNKLVMADPSQLERVFFNLLKNAKEATNGKGKIWLSLEEKDGFAVIGVGNESLGKPIPEEVVDNIFEPFFTSKKKGTGLGLAIVYQILTMIEGTIEVRSNEKETVFKIKIPLLT